MTGSFETTISIGDIDEGTFRYVEVTCEYEVDPGERGDLWHPEYPAGVYLLSVTDEDGKDHLDQLHKSQVRDLEQAATDDAYACSHDEE